jgi:hypothetical protein
MRIPVDVLGRLLLLVWTAAALYELGLFARGWSRNRTRRDRLRGVPNVHPGRVVLARARMRRDATYFGIALVALAIAVASVVGPPGFVGPAIGVGLTLVLVLIGVEGHLSQCDDRSVEKWNAPRDPQPRTDPPSHERRPEPRG